MNTKTKYTAHNITVHPIDRDKLNQRINANANPNIKFNITYGLGIIKEPKPAIISRDLVGNDIVDGKMIIYLFKEELKKDGTKLHSCAPEQELTITLKELESYLKPAITLHEFADDNYERHPRRLSNYRAWMEHFNS